MNILLEAVVSFSCSLTEPSALHSVALECAISDVVCTGLLGWRVEDGKDLLCKSTRLKFYYDQVTLILTEIFPIFFSE